MTAVMLIIRRRENMQEKTKCSETTKKIPKYRKGGQIISIGELVEQEFVYFGNKLTHKGWFMSWQFRFLLQMIYSGRLFYAVKQRPDKIVCNNCGTRFTDESELQKFVESEKDADDTYVVAYSPRLELGEKDIVFKGCPKCRTDAFLANLD